MWSLNIEGIRSSAFRTDRLKRRARDTQTVRLIILFLGAVVVEDLEEAFRRAARHIVRGAELKRFFLAALSR